MPFKSKAQRRKFAQLLIEGKVSNETFEEWNRETGAKELPERVGRVRQRERGRGEGGVGILSAMALFQNFASSFQARSPQSDRIVSELRSET